MWGLAFLQTTTVDCIDPVLCTNRTDALRHLCRRAVKLEYLARLIHKVCFVEEEKLMVITE
jgi:hypothetical protein